MGSWPRPHAWSRGTARHVDAHDPLEVCLGIAGGPSLIRSPDPHMVEHDVELAVGRDRLRHRFLHVGLVRNVAVDIGGVLGADGIGHQATEIFLDISDHDLCPSVKKTVVVYYLMVL